jgi:acyl carrier protein
MTRDEITEKVVAALRRVAPEVDPQTLHGDVPFRDQVDLDSMDFLNFMIAIHREAGLEVPEADYPQLANLSSAVEYVERRLTASGAARSAQ